MLEGLKRRSTSKDENHRMLSYLYISKISLGVKVSSGKSLWNRLLKKDYILVKNEKTAP